MKTGALLLLTLIAFAANSLLNRAALASGGIEPGALALIRVTSGACMLLVLLTVRNRRLPRFPRPNIASTLALTAYLIGFTFGHVSLDAGLGALILFGGVQITMFSGSLVEGGRPPILRWVGMAVSFVGLAVLFWPSGSGAVPLFAIALMVFASVGWGIYSLIGRGAVDPIAATAWNFTYATPLFAVAALFTVTTAPNTHGILLGVISGAITSALGYSMWYALLPALGATRAALAQLSVPVIALVAGAILLAEPITTRAVVASVLILGGIALGLTASRGGQR